MSRSMRDTVWVPVSLCNTPVLHIAQMNRVREVVLGETDGVWFHLAGVVGVYLYTQLTQSVLATGDPVGKREHNKTHIFV